MIPSHIPTEPSPNNKEVPESMNRVEEYCHAQFENAWYLDFEEEEGTMKREEPNVCSTPSSFVEPSLPCRTTSSANMLRNTSCYFSVSSDTGSMSDLLSLIGEYCQDEVTDNEEENLSKTESNPPTTTLYHDILLHILTFLDIKSLQSFSETARGPNLECYYFLQLQLQRALRTGKNKEDLEIQKPNQIKNANKPSKSIPASPVSLENGLTVVTRLASMDSEAAEITVQNIFVEGKTNSAQNVSQQHQAKKLAASSAAFLIMAAGFASWMQAAAAAYEDADWYPSTTTCSSSGGLYGDGYECTSSTPSELLLPNLLFKVVGLLGSIAAAKTMSGQKDPNEEERTNASTPEGPNGGNNRNMQQIRLRMERMMQNFQEEMRLYSQSRSSSAAREDSSPFPFSQMSQAMQRAFSMATESYNQNSTTVHEDDEEKEEEKESDQFSTNTIALVHESPLWTSNPYEHLQPIETPDQEQETHDIPPEQSATSPKSKRIYSGCVGAYLRVVQSSRKQITDQIKQGRKESYNALSATERERIAFSFMEAVRTDDTATVKNLVPGMDVDELYTGPDDEIAQMSAIHVAAFHGAHQVLDFLCRQYDDGDGAGLADVNGQDMAGWTALHFAVGANSLEAIRILLAHGADPSIEATNGFTAFQWAQRLRHEDVEQEFKRYEQERQKKIISSATAGRSLYFHGNNGSFQQQSFTAMANRFLSLIPPTATS